MINSKNKVSGFDSFQKQKHFDCYVIKNKTAEPKSLKSRVYNYLNKHEKNF
jgi:hypothetical protein